MSALDSATLLDLFELGARAGPASPEGRRALEGAIRRIGPEVLALCRRFGPADAAEDLFQETFLQLLLATRGGMVPFSFGPWLVGLVRNLARGEFRRRGRMPPPPAEESGSFERLVAFRLDVTAALTDLPERSREVLKDSVLADLPTASIAARLGVTEANVRQIRSRALRELKKRLPEYADLLMEE